MTRKQVELTFRIRFDGDADVQAKKAWASACDKLINEGETE